jgi:putative aldouronate transport system substrate-binding protein
MMYEGIGEIVLGRQPADSFNQLVRDWKSGGGDQMRAEYEQELASRG